MVISTYAEKAFLKNPNPIHNRKFKKKKKSFTKLGIIENAHKQIKGLKEPTSCLMVQH